MSILLVVGVLAVVIVGYLISTYNTLQSLKTRIKASIQEIGNQLKRQSNLIPNLSESAKAFLAQEKGLFKMLTDARKAVETAQSEGGESIENAIQKLNSVIPKLNVLVESNPEIKSNEVISKLMNELRDTADKIMYSRRVLIDLTADYNLKLVTFPSSIIANAFSFKEEKGLSTPTEGDHISVSEKETKDVKIDL